MLVIRLMRTGRKGESKYRLVVKEKRDKRDGKAVEQLGWYTKTTKGAQKEFNMDRVKYWIQVGAQMSPTVRDLIKA